MNSLQNIPDDSNQEDCNKEPEHKVKEALESKPPQEAAKAAVPQSAAVWQLKAVELPKAVAPTKVVAPPKVDLLNNTVVPCHQYHPGSNSLAFTRCIFCSFIRINTRIRLRRIISHLILLLLIVVEVRLLIVVEVSLMTLRIDDPLWRVLLLLHWRRF